MHSPAGAPTLMAMLGLNDTLHSVRDEDPAERRRRADEIRFGSRPRPRRLLLLLATLALFALAGGWRGLDVVIVIGVVALHEAGHAAGMLAFGYRDVSIFFLPMFGAMTTGHKASVPAWQAAFVSLLGPLPGIFVGLTAWTLAPLFDAPEWLRRVVFLLLVVNFLNLLPFLPFDGGHFFKHLLFHRKRRLETVFAVIGGIGIAGLALWFRDGILAVAAWLAFAGIGGTRRVQDVAAEAEQNGWTNAGKDDTVLGVDELVAERFPEVSEERRLGLVRRVLSGLGSERASPVAVTLLVLLYATPFAVAATIYCASLLGSPSGRLRMQAGAEFARSNYEKAADLMGRAALEEPEAPGVFSELGWALNAAQRPEEARDAFSREIERNPRHPYAYLGRAMALDRLGRFSEADADLRKQVEIAPSSADAFGALGHRRLRQRRLDDAVAYLTRATTLDSSQPGAWIELGWAHALAGHPAAAQVALGHVQPATLPEPARVNAAGAYGAAGEPRRAAALAATTLPALQSQLAGLTRSTYGTDDLARTQALVEAWALVGAGALAEGRTRDAERYLGVAWRRGFAPAAAWQLGRLCEKQGRHVEAVEFWEMAVLVPLAPWRLPADYRRQLEAVEWRLGLAGRSGFQGNRLTRMRTSRLARSAPEKLAEPVLLLVDGDGVVEEIRGLSGRNTPALDRQLQQRGAVRLDLPRPNADALKTVHAGLLVCAAPTGCSLILDLPGP